MINNTHLPLQLSLFPTPPPNPATLLRFQLHFNRNCNKEAIVRRQIYHLFSPAAGKLQRNQHKWAGNWWQWRGGIGGMSFIRHLRGVAGRGPGRRCCHRRTDGICRKFRSNPLWFFFYVVRPRHHPWWKFIRFDGNKMAEETEEEEEEEEEDGRQINPMRWNSLYKS